MSLIHYIFQFLNITVLYFEIYNKRQIFRMAGSIESRSYFSLQL
jgi:hypothetical protein